MLTREKLVQQHENLQKCQRFYPKETAHHRFAHYLAAECEALCDASYAHLLRCYAVSDLFDRYWLLLEYSDELSKPMFDRFWKCLQKQQEALCVEIDSD